MPSTESPIDPEDPCTDSGTSPPELAIVTPLKNFPDAPSPEEIVPDLPQTVTVEEYPFDYLDGLHLDDTDNVKRLLVVVDDRLRYADQWGKFLVYGDDGIWHVDYKDVRTMEMAKGVSEQLYEDIGRVKADLDDVADEEQAKSFRAAISNLEDWAKHSADRSGRSNMVHLARGEQGVLIDHEDLETHPYLVNVANGTWDFEPVRDDPKNGQPIFRDHAPEDLLLLQAPTEWDAEAECPLWERCLEQWQPDQEIRDYLQMRAGACILGVPTETLDVDYGTGANGKSKFHGAIQNAIGAGPTGYSIVPHKSLLMAQRFGEHDTVYADLFRKRMAAATETKAGEKLDEESVKSLTGGDRIKGRRMREDSWSFDPTHSMILHTNYRPRINGTDEAIWRRVHLVPWEITIPEDQRDERLAEKLVLEAPGILRWILDGALMFLRRGWFVPESIVVATDEYRDGEDLIGRFLADCVDITKDPSHLTPFSAIQSAAERWRMVDGLQYPIGPKQLAEGLVRAGATKGKRVATAAGKESQWIGLQLL